MASVGCSLDTGPCTVAVRTTAVEPQPVTLFLGNQQLTIELFSMSASLHTGPCAWG